MKLDIKYPAVKVAKSMLDDIEKWVNEELANGNNEDLEGFELSEMLTYDKDGFFDFSNATFDEVVKALAFAANKHIGLEIEVVAEVENN